VVIVECSQCSTRFQLDESRVPAKGIKVRCSRCKHAFFLRPPDASQSQAVDELASEAAREGVVPPPDATQDLATHQQVEPDAGGGEEEDEESDWQFNEEVPSGDGGDLESDEDLAEDPSFTRGESDLAAAEAGEEPPGLDDLESEDEPPGLDDLESGDEPPGLDDGLGEDESTAFDDGEVEDEREASEIPGLDHGNTPPQAEPVDGSHFGSVEDFSSLVEEEQAGESSLSSEALAAVDQLLSPESRSAAGEELGDPESWDFFSDQSLESASPFQRADFSSETATGAEVSASGLSQRVAAEIDAFDSDLDAYPGELLSPAASDSWVQRAGRAVGWILVVALFGAGVARGLFPDFRPMIEPPSAVQLGDLRAVELRGSWLDTARAGTLFAVTGQLRNQSNTEAVRVGALQVALLDARGEHIPLEPAPLGAPLDRALLRELPIDALWRSRGEAARELAASVLPPGGFLSVEAVFASVPVAATRYQLEFASAADASGLAEQEAPEKGLAAETPPTEVAGEEAESARSGAREVELVAEGIPPAATTGSSPR
jgi:predicted Zn finger-like uncharacterized protein